MEDYLRIWSAFNYLLKRWHDTVIGKWREALLWLPPIISLRCSIRIRNFFRRYMLDNLFTRYSVTGENVMIALSRVYDRHLQHCRIILDHSERGHLLEQASLNSNAIWKILNCCLPRQNSFKKRVSFNERFVVAVCFKVISVKSIVSEANIHTEFGRKAFFGLYRKE